MSERERVIGLEELPVRIHQGERVWVMLPGRPDYPIVAPYDMDLLGITFQRGPQAIGITVRPAEET